MANTSCFKVFRLCFLIMYVLQNIDYTRADVRRPMINYYEMNKLITNTKSVSVDGNTSHLVEWLGRIVEENKVDEDINLIIMNTFVKCECAHLIGDIVEYISTRNAKISQLQMLNKEIKRAISVLFEISDYYPILKQSGEPYFLRTLLMTSFYIDGVSAAIKPSSQSDALDDTNRTLLQIINLFERFTVEYCSVVREGNKQGNDNRTFDDRLKDLREFLKSIVYLSTDPPYSLFDIDGIKLERCLQDGIPPEKSNLETFCTDILKPAFNRKKRNTNIILMFYEIQFSYDIEAIYDYMLEVYTAILELLYKVTPRVWDNGKSLDVKWCTEQISILKSMNFPIEIINNFELALRVQHRKSARAYALTNNIKDIFNTSSSIYGFSDNFVVKFTLSDLMDTILDVEFKCFWWVFNLLTKASDKKSVMIDETALNNFPPITYDIKCDELTGVYGQSIYIENQNKNCIAKNSITSIPECSTTVCSLVLTFTDFLLEQMNKWNFKEDYKAYDELGRIILAAIINLRNKCQENNMKKSKLLNVQNKIEEKCIIEKHETLKRTLDVFINALDYHQIRKCDVIINRKSVTETVKGISPNVQPVNDKRSFVVSVIQLIKKSSSRQSEQTSNNTVPIGYYDLKILTAKDSLNSDLAGITYFNWHGQVKSVRDIQSDISENMLDLHDLVEYERLYSKWMVYIFYKLWLNVFDRIFRDQNDEYINSSNFDDAVQWLIKVANFILRTYANGPRYESIMLRYIRLVKGYTTHQGREKVDLAEKEIINPTIQLLGVIEKTEKISGERIEAIQKFTGINSRMVDFEQLFKTIEDNNLKAIRIVFIYGLLH